MADGGGAAWRVDGAHGGALPTSMWYCAVPRLCPGTVPCGTKPGKGRTWSTGGGAVATTVADDAASAEPADVDPFRQRLLDGLAASITERGYRASTVADIVRHARTSKRTFYDQFASKEQCFLELLHADVEKLGEDIRDAVDPEADWQTQIRQAVEAYVGHIEARPAHHVELDPRTAVTGCRGAAVPASRHATADQPADQPQRQPGVHKGGLPPLTGHGGDPGRRPARTDRARGRRRAQCARDRRACRPRLGGAARVSALGRVSLRFLRARETRLRQDRQPR